MGLRLHDIGKRRTRAVVAPHLLRTHGFVCTGTLRPLLLLLLVLLLPLPLLPMMALQVLLLLFLFAPPSPFFLWGLALA